INLQESYNRWVLYSAALQHDFNSGSDNGVSNTGSGSAVFYDSGSGRSYDAGSYDTGSNDSYSSNSNGSYDAGSAADTAAEAGSEAAKPAAAEDGWTVYANGVARKGSYVTVPSFEVWRQTANAQAGTYTVTHCGIERYTLQLTDRDGKAVGYKSCGILKDEAGKYWLNVVTADGVDAEGWTIGTCKGTAAYLPKLGLSGVKLDGVVVVEAQ
ncbi:MAG: hypothetical protein NC548_49650, partial [Lachnospiraceae bacterium]|nr:hypothetical protein [Lachnospiraceae bacterium]